MGTNTEIQPKRLAVGIRARQFDQVICDEYFDRMSSGETITSIIRDHHMPNDKTMFEWCNGKLGAPSSLRRDYARARLRQADAFARAVIDLADLSDPLAHASAVDALNNLPEDATTTEKRRAYFYAQKRSVEGTKMAIDARKWVAARMAPHLWGDQVTIQHIGEGEDKRLLDMSQLTTEQLEELSRLQRQVAAGETEVIEITANSSVETVPVKTKSTYTEGWIGKSSVIPGAVTNATATG